MIVPAPAKNFLEYEPLLWRVLSKLARDGYAILPHDARDLIHDFYLEWESLNSRFDADKGEFAPYLATAFYRFGRRRQLKLHRLRSRAVDLEECLDLAAADPLPLEAAELKQQIAQLKAAIGQLPASEQALLADFLSDFAPGERELAEKHRLTRYRMREQLAATVSRVALQMLEAEPQSGDADIAYRVWVSGQSPRMVAAELGISTDLVNRAKARFAQALLNSVRMGTSPTHREGRMIMVDFEVLKNALTAVNDSNALDRLRAKAPQIRTALEEDDFILDEEASAALALQPEWLARVYSVLAGPEPMSDADEMYSNMAAILVDEQFVIADAWAALLDKLDERRPPAVPGKWELALQLTGKPDPKLLRHLREFHPSCRKGDPAAERLLQYGLTPGMVFEALRGMELLFNRSLRRAENVAVAGCSRYEGLIVKDGGKRVPVSQECVNFDIAGALDLASELVAPLGNSLWCMLQESPFLVNGYQYAGGNAFVKLRDAAEQEGFLSRDKLIRRWCADAGQAGALEQRKLPGWMRRVEAGGCTEVGGC
jgi:RNA polymerase sigma factor (sigma-70 family)